MHCGPTITCVMYAISLSVCVCMHQEQEHAKEYVSGMVFELSLLEINKIGITGTKPDLLLQGVLSCI